jgi:hypothetical protein
MSLEQERRRHLRVAVQQIVSLTSSTCIGDKAALTEDVSLGGVLLKTKLLLVCRLPLKATEVIDKRIQGPRFPAPVGVPNRVGRVITARGWSCRPGPACPGS